MPSTSNTILYDNRGSYQFVRSSTEKERLLELSESLQKLGISDTEELLYIYDVPPENTDASGVLLQNSDSIPKFLFSELNVSCCPLTIRHPDGAPFLLATAKPSMKGEAISLHLIPASWIQSAFQSEKLRPMLHTEQVMNGITKQFLLEHGLYQALQKHPMHAGFVDGILYFCSAEGASDGRKVSWMDAPASLSRMQAASRALAGYGVKSFDRWLDTSGDRSFLEMSERRNSTGEYIVDCSFAMYEYLWRKQKDATPSLLSYGIEKALATKNYEELHELFEPFFDENAESITEFKALATS